MVQYIGGCCACWKDWQAAPVLYTGQDKGDATWQLLALFAAPGGSSAHGGPGRIGAWLRLGLAEGAKQLSPWAVDALCWAPGSAQVSSVVPQR